MQDFTLSAFADEIDKDLTVQMDVLEKHDIRFIEMRGVGGRGIVMHSIEEVAEIKKQLDARGFGISAVGSPLGKIDITEDFPPHLALFNHTLEIAGILETKYIRLFSFYIPEGGKPEAYRDEVFRRLDAFLTASFGTNLVLLHENEKKIYGDTPERCLDLLSNFAGRNFRAIFDAANFIQGESEPFPYAFEMLKDYIEYLHIKDAVVSDGHVVPAGMGDGRIPEILEALRAGGFRGFLSLEPHLKNFEGFAQLEKDADNRTGRRKGSGEDAFNAAATALKGILKGLA